MLTNRCVRFFSGILTKAELEGISSHLSSWTVNGHLSINNRFTFNDFKEAWEFMELVAKVADQHDHHPEWTNVYNRIDVNLTTHDAGGITKKDLWLAKFMDKAELLVKHEHED